MDVGDRAAADQQFEVWYRAEYPRLVSSLTILAGSSDVGADVAAEAFTRAYEHWSRVAMMQSPGGWVRNVAVNPSTSPSGRRRTAGVGPAGGKGRGAATGA